MTLQNKIDKASSKEEAMFESEAIGEMDVGLDEEERGVVRKIINSVGKRKLSAAILVIVVALGHGAYDKFFNLSDAERAQKELAVAIKAVSKHMILPEGDEPMLATVTDAEMLIKQQVFFSSAINGDQLLLFPRNLKAIIYSPSRNKVVNAGPIEQAPRNYAESPRSSAFGPQESATVGAPPLTVEVRNGTDKTGYATTIAEQIAANAAYTIIKVSDAGRNDYRNTIVFVRANDENKKPKVNTVANTFGVAATNELPKGEKSTEADVLIILGSQK